jgi:RNA-splicing ligase RtcB
MKTFIEQVNEGRPIEQLYDVIQSIDFINDDNIEQISQLVGFEDNEFFKWRRAVKTSLDNGISELQEIIDKRNNLNREFPYFKGKYSDCIVYNHEVETTAIGQIYRFLNHIAFANSKIRIMPDVHCGNGSVIGYTSTFDDKIIPNVVGVDIGCGVITVPLGNIEIDYQQLDNFIREQIPCGFKNRSKLPTREVLDLTYSRVREQLKLSKLSGQMIEQFELVSKKIKMDPNRTVNALGTLGGGNHFIEVGVDNGNNKYLTVHTGSRHFGLQVATFHQKIADQKNPYGELSYLETVDKDSYLEDMKTAQIFAAWNRQIISELIKRHLDVITSEFIESVHNYIDFESGIIRKGAISAKQDQLVVIPWNMRDGLIIGKGKGNSDWNFSAPHGAGRKMGRTVAKKTLSLEQFQQTMEGVWTSCVNKSTLDESPMAYKDSEQIEKYLNDTVEIITKVKPTYNFKAAE